MAGKVDGIDVEALGYKLWNQLVVLPDVALGVFTQTMLEEDVGLRVFTVPQKSRYASADVPVLRL